jgi:hypothetical protein
MYFYYPWVLVGEAKTSMTPPFIKRISAFPEV